MSKNKEKLVDMSDNMKWIITGIIVVLISAAEVMWFWPWFVRWCLGE